MLAKTKNKTLGKMTSLPIDTHHFNPSTILKNKKITMGVGIVIILLALIVFFKSIFIAAIVNGEPITRLSVISSLEKQAGKTTLNSLITKKLILQEAKKRNVSITQSEIDLEIKKIDANLKTQGSTLDQELAYQGMTKSNLNDELKIQLLLDKMAGTNVTLTEKEIDDFVTANKSQMTSDMTEAQFREQTTQKLKQQKTQTKTQDFIKNLQDKASIIQFVSY